MHVMILWVLFVFVFSIFLLSIFLIWNFSKQKMHPQSFTSVNQRGEFMDYPYSKQRIMEMIRLKYPQILILFEDISCKTCLLLHFKGLSKEKESVVYVLRKEDAELVFFAAVEQLLEDAKTPKYGMVIAIPYTNTTNQEMISTLQKRNISLRYIYTDEAEMLQFTSIPSPIAILARGRKPYVMFEVSHDNEDYDWLGDLNNSILFEPEFSQEVYPCVHAIKDLLSKDMQIALHTFPMFKKGVMEEVLDKVPESTTWFLPVIDKQDTKLFVYAQNVQQLEKACELIKSSAKKAKVILKEIKKDTATYHMDADDEDLLLIENIIQDTLHVGHVIPVLLENSFAYPVDIPILSFAPLMQNQVLNHNDAI